MAFLDFIDELRWVTQKKPMKDKIREAVTSSYESARASSVPAPPAMPPPRTEDVRPAPQPIQAPVSTGNRPDPTQFAAPGGGLDPIASWILPGNQPQAQSPGNYGGQLESSAPRYEPIAQPQEQSQQLERTPTSLSEAYKKSMDVLSFGEGLAKDIKSGAANVNYGEGAQGFFNELNDPNRQGGDSGWLTGGLKRVGSEFIDASDAIASANMDLSGITAPIALGENVYNLARGNTPETEDTIWGSPTVENIREASSPRDWYDRQVESFAERPMSEQLSSMLFDPTNVIGAGALGGMLRGAGRGLASGGRFGRAAGRVASGAGAADEALTAAGNMATREVLGAGAGAIAGGVAGGDGESAVMGGLAGAGLGAASRAVRPGLRAAGQSDTLSSLYQRARVSDEQGGVYLPGVSEVGRGIAGTARGVDRATSWIPQRSLRTASTGVGATGGYHAGEDTSPEDRIKNMFIGAAGGAVFPEATAGLGKVAGMPARMAKPFTGDLTMGHVIPRIVRSLPRDERFANSPIRLPNFKSVRDKLTVSDKVKNRALNSLGITSDPVRNTIKKNGRVNVILASQEENVKSNQNFSIVLRETIRNVFDNAGMQFDEAGHLLGRDGDLLPVFDPEDGTLMVTRVDTGEGKELVGTWGAGISDVRQALEKHPHIYDDFLTEEQIRAVYAFDPIAEDVKKTLTVLGDEADWVQGFFPRSRYLDDQPTVFRPGRRDFPEGRKPGSMKARTFTTQAEGIAVKGRAELPWDAVQRYVKDNYDRISAMHHREAILDTVGPDGRRIGDSINEKALKEMEDINKEFGPKINRRKRLVQWLSGAEKRERAELRGEQRNRAKIGKVVERLSAVDPVERPGDLAELARFSHQTIRDGLREMDTSRKAMIGAGRDAYREARRYHRAQEVARDAQEKLERSTERFVKFDERAGRLEVRMPTENELKAMPIEHMRDLYKDALRAYDSAISLRDAADRSALRSQRYLRQQIESGVNVDQAKRWLDLTIKESGDVQREIVRDVNELHRMVFDEMKKTGKANRAAIRQSEQAGRLKGKQALIQQEEKRRAGRMESLAKRVKAVRRELDLLDMEIAPAEVRKAELERDIAVANQIASTRTHWSKGAIHIDPLKNYPLPAEWADYINRAIGKRLDMKEMTEEAKFEALNNLFRLLGTGFDYGMQFTTGVAGLYDDPAKAVAANIRGVQASRGEGFWEYMLTDLTQQAVDEGLPTPAYLMSHGFEVGSPEVITGSGKLIRDSWTEKATRLPIVKPIQQHFDAASNDMRFNYVYENLRRAKADGRDPWDTQVLSEAMASALQLSGRSKGTTLPFLSDRANGMLFFASRYTRAVIESNINAIVSGNMVGDNARRALMRTYGLSAATAWTISQITGQGWNPQRPFEFQLGDWHVDLTGGYSTFLQRGYNALDSAAEGDWRGSVTEVQRFFEGKLSPVASRGVKLLDSVTQDFRGEGEGTELSAWEVPALSKWVKESDFYMEMLPLPFASRDMIEGYDSAKFESPEAMMKYLFGIPLGLLGTKVRPLTDRDRYYQSTDEAYEEYVPPFYEKGEGWGPEDDPLFRSNFRKLNPDLVPEADTLDQKEMEAARELRDNSIDEAERQFLAENITLGEFTEKHQEANIVYRSSTERLTKGFDGDAKHGTPAWWANEFYGLYDEAKIEGTIFTDYDRYNILVEEKKNALDAEFGEGTGETAFQYVQELGLVNASPTYESYRRAINTLADGGYFDANKLPPYRSLKHTNHAEVRDHLGYVARFSPEELKGEPFDEKVGNYLLRNERSPVFGKDPQSDEVYDWFVDLNNAYKAQQAITWLRNNEGMPSRGTLAREGITYMNEDYLFFIEQHEAELEWLKGGYFIDQLDVE